MMMLLLPFLFGFLVNADLYLQCPMGSNNRLDDENRDRNNANRLCDTQNNNRGGYNVGNVYYYAGTVVPVKWTAQHSCGNPNNHCEIIIQMMCDDRLRDGTTQNTIPDNPVECYNWDCDTDVRYGRHESFDFYQTCKKTERNKGLFIADQNIKGSSARYTRQNPNGARRGYECPEERDYYPYWRPSPWVDIAYFTNDKDVCPSVVAMTQNLAPRHYCKIKMQYLYMKHVFTTPLPITQQKCETLEATIPNMVAQLDDAGEFVLDDAGEKVMVQDGTKKVFPGKWILDGSTGNPPLYPKSYALGEKIAKPICMGNTWSRDNHHGNVMGGDFSGFDWTVPDIEEDNCVLRVRYNISTGDLPHFDTNLTTAPLDEWSSGEGSNKDKGKYYVGYQLGLTKDEIDMNGYYFKNNPQVAPFYKWAPGGNEFAKGTGENADPLKFQLAINTAQYGRTFQDRSHKFSIKPKPKNIGTAVIHNLQVRGKRGNIVQTYPGTEYSFAPEELEVSVGSFVHFQWVGSNTNPNNNAGQGRQGSDRHNVATLRPRQYDEAGQAAEWVAEGSPDNIYGQLGGSYPAYIGKNPVDETYDNKKLSEFLGFSNKQRRQLAILKGINTNGGELSELDDSGTYADFPPWEVKTAGFYNYLCTRNNNFSNRSQKGKIKAVPAGMQTMKAQISYSGASLNVGGAYAVVDEGSTTQPVIGLQPMGNPTNGFCGSNCGSQYYMWPTQVTDASVEIGIAYAYKADKVPVVYYTTSSSVASDNWEKVEGATCDGGVGDDGTCKFTPASTGIYVVYNEVSWWVYLLSIIAAIIGVVILCCLFKRFKGSTAN